MPKDPSIGAREGALQKPTSDMEGPGLAAARVASLLGQRSRKRVEERDTKVPGLVLSIRPSGAASWALRYRRPDGGAMTTFTIGNAREKGLGLKEARDQAVEADRRPGLDRWRWPRIRGLGPTRG